MIAGGGASWATAGCMTQPAAIRRVVRAIESGEPSQLSELGVNFIPFIVIPLIFVVATHILCARRVIAQSAETRSGVERIVVWTAGVDRYLLSGVP
jgi:hypothetical protein